MTELPWPLRHIVDERGRDTGFCFVRGPLGHSDKPLFDALAVEHRMLGLTSSGPFPLRHEAYGSMPGGSSPEDGWKRTFVEPCEAWAHCFREPDAFLPPGRGRSLLGGSDFTNPDRVWKNATPEGIPAKRWDVVYSCLANEYNEVQKNWELARACVVRLGEAGLRVLLVGRAGSPDVPQLRGVETCEFLRWREFLQCVARSRVAFFPNRLDASPRALTEALALDVPVLVNEGILGGWKYVTPETGEFFRSEGDVVAGAERILSAGLEPRSYYIDHYGVARAEERLAELLRSLGPDPLGRMPASEAARARFVGVVA